MLFRHSPADQVITGDLVLVHRRGKGVHVPAGDNDGLGPDAIEAPRFLQTAEHVFVNAGEGDQSGEEREHPGSWWQEEFFDELLKTENRGYFRQGVAGSWIRIVRAVKFCD